MECPGVNSNYTFLQDHSQPKPGSEESHGWLATIPFRAHVPTDTQAGHKSGFGICPLRIEVAATSSLKYTNHPLPPPLRH